MCHNPARSATDRAYYEQRPQMVTNYAWANEKAKVKIYVPMEGCSAVDDSDICLVSPRRCVREHLKRTLWERLTAWAACGHDLDWSLDGESRAIPFAIDRQLGFPSQALFAPCEQLLPSDSYHTCLFVVKDEGRKRKVNVNVRFQSSSI